MGRTRTMPSADARHLPATALTGFPAGAIDSVAGRRLIYQWRAVHSHSSSSNRLWPWTRFNCCRNHRRPRPNGENGGRHRRLFWHLRRDRPCLPFRRRKRCCAATRDMAKAMANLADMPDVRLEIMNLLDPGSIDAFAEQFLRDDEKLHILVNNAGSPSTSLANVC